MRTIALTTAATALIAATSYGDVTYSLPGLTEVKSLSGDNTSATTDLGFHWKYVITGYKWKVSAGAPNSGSVDNEGYYLSSNGQRVTLKSELTASINGKTITTGNEYLESAKISDNVTSTDPVVSDAHGNKLEVTTTYSGDTITSSGSVTFSKDQYIEISLENIALTVSHSGSMNAGDGTYIQFSGVAIKDTPTATGKVYPVKEGEATSKENYFLASIGTTPTIHWEIALDGEPVDFSPNPEEIQDTWKYTETEIVKNNNGHGNNEDGVDSSNPGKSKKHNYDPSGDVDDEIRKKK